MYFGLRPLLVRVLKVGLARGSGSPPLLPGADSPWALAIAGFIGSWYSTKGLYTSLPAGGASHSAAYQLFGGWPRVAVLCQGARSLVTNRFVS